MNRRTRRSALLTFAARPWNLFEDDPGAGGGGGGAPAVNANGFPDNTPVADMSTEHQVAYWKHHARKHEQRANTAPDAAELETLRAAAAELATRKASEMTETQRIQAEKDAAEAARVAAEAERDAARAETLRVGVAASKGLTPEQAGRLRGATKEELEADADALKALFAPAPPANHRPPTGGGSDVGAGKDVNAGAARYAARNPKTT